MERASEATGSRGAVESAGQALSRAYYREVVGPLLTARWPALPHAAGRLGPGSDVLGLDDETSRDHDWGLRLTLFVGEPMVGAVHEYLDQSLPETFAGHPTRFAFTGRTEPVHHVEVTTVTQFLLARLGLDPRGGMCATDWLSLTGQAVLEVLAGPVFADEAGELGRLRQLLEWYPDDVWRYVLACDWARFAEEMPLMSRAGERGDALGSQVIAARLVDVAMHLGFTLERRWAPYAKWRGTMFAELACAGQVAPLLAGVIEARDWRSRQDALAAAVSALGAAQRGAGLPTPERVVGPFWDRPYLVVPDDVAARLLDGVTSLAVRSLPSGRGSAEQQSDNVAFLLDPVARRQMVGGTSGDGVTVR